MFGYFQYMKFKDVCTYFFFSCLAMLIALAIGIKYKSFPLVIVFYFMISGVFTFIKHLHNKKHKKYQGNIKVF